MTPTTEPLVVESAPWAGFHTFRPTCGDAHAANNLGLLLKDRGETEEAEAAYRRADERGDAYAAFNLGLLLYARGELEGAEAPTAAPTSAATHTRPTT